MKSDFRNHYNIVVGGQADTFVRLAMTLAGKMGFVYFSIGTPDLSDLAIGAYVGSELFRFLRSERWPEAREGCFVATAERTRRLVRVDA